MAGWQILFTFSDIILFLCCVKANSQHLMQESGIIIPISLEYYSLNTLNFVPLGVIFIMQLIAELTSF